jgi:tight adherence protein B
MQGLIYQLVASGLLFAAVYLTVVYGVAPAKAWLRRQEQAYDATLRGRLLIDIDPHTALITSLAGIGVAALLTYVVTSSVVVALIAAGTAFFVPHAVIRHLEFKRRRKLEEQLVDALTTLAAGTRAGLNLIQSMDLVIQNHRGPVQQEFAQLKREYDLGTDLDQAMRNASNRIGSPLYRLTFTAIEMHRKRGGDAAHSLDRIAESIREVQRLEGKLDALTSQGRTQAVMMAVMPLVFIAILYMIDAGGVMLLFFDPIGRIILLGVVVMILLAFLWIRRILAVDI